MQAIKNSLKSILRTPGKSLLFFAVLAAVAVLLSVSFCVYSASHGYLRDAEEYFHTIAELEYLGEDYPERDVWDPAVSRAVGENREALDALLADGAVLSFEAEYPALGLIEGLHRSDQNVYDAGSAVIGVSILSYDPQFGQYTAIVSREYYSLRSYRDKMINIRFFPADQIRWTSDNKPWFPEEVPQLELHKRYVLSGYYGRGQSAGAYFYPEAILFEDETGSAETSGWMEVEDYELPAESVFSRLARTLHIRNDSCRITCSSDLPDLLPFHQQESQLLSGRFFTEAEYDSRAKVCILSEHVAGRLGAQLGDGIPMEVFTSEGDLYEVSSLTEAEAGVYELVGVCTEVDSSPYQIYLPGARETSLQPVTGYTLGRFRLDNEKTASFLKRAEELEAKGFRIAVYDQGYAAATEPIRELLYVSVVFLVVCLLLAALALSLQSRLFVTRQREAAETMFALGGGRGHIRIYFLSASLLLTVCAALVGCAAGRRIEGRVLALMQSFAAQFPAQDTRFSFSRLALVRTLDFDPRPALTVYLSAAGALVLGSLFFTLLSARLGRKEGRGAKRSASSGPKRRFVSVRGKTSRLSGPLKYALLSLRRSRTRSVSALLLCAAAAIFFCRLTASLDSYEAQLRQYQSEAVIRGYATDYFGRRMDRLSLRAEPIRDLLGSGLIGDANLTNTIGPCTVLGVAVTAEGERRMDPFEEPETHFEKESLYLEALRNGRWVLTSSVGGSPQLRHRAASLTWLEGCDESSFLQPLPVCALSAGLMREQNIRLGDCILLLSAIPVGESIEIRQAVLKVVASYASETASKTVFSPLNTGFVFSEDPYEAYENSKDFVIDYPAEGSDAILLWKLQCMNEEDLQRVRYSSFTFALRDASALDVLRGAMAEAGYTWVNSGDRIHGFAMLKDEMYLNTVHSMERQIRYVGTLYDFLYGIAGILGAALAWLLGLSRRREIALMRMLGTPKFRILANFFFEQVLLCAGGLGAVLTLRRFAGPVPALPCLLCAAFFGLWCLSTLLCLAGSLHKKALSSLTEPE